MKKFIIVLSAAVLMATSSVVFAKAKELKKLTFTYVTSPLNIPSIIEKDQKIFANEFKGTPVEYAEITSGAEQTQALASGDVQVLYAVGGSSVILSAANGADIKVLNMYSRAPKAFCLYSKDASLNSPESLRGKKIAGPAGTNLHELLTAYLASAGMKITDVSYVSMGIPAAKAALDGGSIDVALLAGAAAYNAGAQGYHKITDGDGYIAAIIAVATTEKFYKQNPDVIKKLASAQKKIANYIAKNKDQAFATTANYLGLTEQAVKDMSAAYDFSTELTQADMEGWQKTADFMYASGMIDNKFDVKKLFIK